MLDTPNRGERARTMSDPVILASVIRVHERMEMFTEDPPSLVTYTAEAGACINVGFEASTLSITPSARPLLVTGRTNNHCRLTQHVVALKNVDDLTIGKEHFRLSAITAFSARGANRLTTELPPADTAESPMFCSGRS